jgi:hypothetical protein
MAAPATFAGRLLQSPGGLLEMVWSAIALTMTGAALRVQGVGMEWEKRALRIP